MFPVFLAIFLKHKDFPRLMNEGHFPRGGRFHFLLSSLTLLAGSSLLVIQKAKLLNMNS